MADWIALYEVQWTSPPLFGFRLPRHVLCEKFGPPHQVNLDSNGAGRFDGWFLRYPCGLEVAIWWFHNLPQTQTRAQPNEPTNIQIRASEADRDHILSHLDLPVTQVQLWEPEPSFVGDKVWVVRRQDDNGNIFDVGRYSSRCEAEIVADRFEARGHKQFYWFDGP